jgi:carboxymethylenebutenolidase
MAVLAHEGPYSILYGPFGVPTGSGYAPGYIARPDQFGRFPTVLLAPDEGVVDSDVKDIARRLARRGLAVVVIGSARGGDAPDDERVGVDLDEAQQFLASDDIDWTFPDALGLMGLGSGGRSVLVHAAYRPWVRAVVTVGGPLSGDEDGEQPVLGLLPHVAAPVLGLYGAEDDSISPGLVDQAQGATPRGQWLLYEGSGTGFWDIDSDGYDQGASDDAEARITAFMLAALPASEVEDLG